MKRILCAAAFLAGIWSGCTALERRPATGWWKGNTHTHTLWSDGNAAPEKVAAWYREQAYDFLVLSDHNILSVGDKWFPVKDDGRLTAARMAELVEVFGDEWVDIRDHAGWPEMRLKNLADLRQHFEVPGEFIFIQGEEITDSFRDPGGTGHPVHVNGINLQELIVPRHGSSVREVMQNNVNAVIEQSERVGRPMLAHINHPNFGWGLTWEDVAAIEGERFFEVYNGHSGVRNHGDESHPSTEEMWDLALTWRLEHTDLGLLYGIATDDSHEYFAWGAGKTNPGRGWVMVRSATLTPDSIVAAMRAGDFYASSGVVLEDVSAGRETFVVDIATEPEVSYTTEFVVRRRSSVGGSAKPLEGHLTRSDPAVYRFRGDELYVRARVVSSRRHPNPYAEGDYEAAWVQPVQPHSR